MTKRILALVLCLVLLASIFSFEVFAVENTGANSSYFTDVVRGTWYYDVVTKMASLGVFSGVGNNRYDPNSALTRAAWASVLQRIFGFSGNGTANDISGHWASIPIKAAIASGILGTTNGNFYPDSGISRADAITALGRALGINESGSSTSQFSDLAGLPTATVNIINAMAAQGYVSGTSAGIFSPYKVLTRAEAAAFIDRPFSYLSLASGSHTYADGIAAKIVSLNNDIVTVRNLKAVSSVILGKEVDSATFSRSTVSKLLVMGDSSVDLGDSNFSNGIMIDSDEFELMSDEASGDILVTKATSGEFDGVFEDEIVFDSVNLEYVDVYDDAEISSMIINEDTDWDADDFEMNNDGVIDNLEIYIEGDITGSGVIKKLSAYENLTLVKSPTVSMYVDKNTTVKIGSSTFSGGSSGRTFSSGEMGYVGGDGKYLNTNTSYYRLSGGEHKVSEWLNGASIERITTGSGSILTSGTYGHWFLSGGYLRFYEYYMQTLPTGESKFIVYLTNGDSQAFYVTVYASGSTSWQGKYLETNTSYAKNSNTDHTVPTWLDYYTISKIENQSGVVLSSSDWYTSGSSLYFRRSYLDGLAYGSYRFRVYVNSGDYQDIYLDVSQYGSTTVGRYFTATTYYAKNTSSEHVVPATNSGYSVSRIANSAGSTISAAYYYYSGGYLRFTVAYMQSLAIGTTRLSVYMSNGDYQDIYIVVSQEGASGSGNYFNTNTTYNRTTGGNHDVLHWIGSTRTVSRIENENSVVLTQNSAYTVGGTYLTFYNSYMQALAVGQRRFRVYLSDGYYQDIYITVTTNTSSSVQYDLNPSGSQHTDLVLQGVTGLYNGGVMFNGVYLNSSAYSYDVSARTVRIWSSILAGYSVGTYTVRLGSGGTLYYTISVVDTRTTGTTYTYDLNPYGAQHTTVRMYAPSASALYVNNSSRGSTYWYVSSDGYVTLLLLDSYAVGTYNIGISGSSGQWYTYTLGIVDTRTSGNSGTLIWDKSSNGVKNNTVTGLPGLSYVSLNGSVLGSGYYSYTSGILTVVSTYLNSLAVGEYTLVVNTGIDIRTYTLNVVNIPANGADSRIVVVYDRYSLGSQHITPKFYAPGTTDMTLNGGVVNRSSWGLGSDGYVSYLLASSLGIGEYQVNLIGNSTVTWYYTLKIVDTSY